MERAVVLTGTVAIAKSNPSRVPVSSMNLEGRESYGPPIFPPITSGSRFVDETAL